MLPHHVPPVRMTTRTTTKSTSKTIRLEDTTPRGARFGVLACRPAPGEGLPDARPSPNHRLQRPWPSRAAGARRPDRGWLASRPRADGPPVDQSHVRADARAT